MPEKEFDIVITENSVDVRHDVSSESPKRRFYAGLFFLMLIILGACVLVLLPGKHGRPNMWHSLSSSPIDSADFIVPLSLVLIFVIWMSYVGTRWLLAAYPSDEALTVTDRPLLYLKFHGLMPVIPVGSPGHIL
jgi:hypothetical protein